MKAFAFFTSSSKKTENKDATRPRQYRVGSNGSTQSYPRPSLESFCSPEPESFVSRVAGRRAFSSSTPHLLHTPPAHEPLPRKPSVFRRPRFAIFRDATPTPAAERSRSYGAQEPPPPLLKQPQSTRRAMMIPPMPPLPPDFAQTRLKGTPNSSCPPREPLPVLPPSRSRAEARAVLCSASRAEVGKQRRSKSVTARSRTGTQAIPVLDKIWNEFVYDVAGEMPQMPRLHSYDVSPTTRRAPTRPLPLAPKEVPGIVVSCRPATPDLEKNEESSSQPTPEPLIRFHSREASSLHSRRLFSSSHEQTALLGIERARTSLTPEHTTSSPSKEALQHLAPSLPSGASIAATYYHHSETLLSPQLDRQISCSSSEVSLSLFPLPPSLCDAPAFTPRHLAVKPTLHPKTQPQCIRVPPPLEDSRASCDSSDPESPTSPIDTKYPSLVKFYPLKTQMSMESVSTVTTEEWAEIPLAGSPSFQHPYIRTPWDDSHAGESSYDYAGAVTISQKIHLPETGKPFVP